MAARKKKIVRITAKMKDDARKSVKNHLKEPMFGVEQVFDGQRNSHLTLWKTLDWYNARFDQRQSKKWALEWIATHPALAKHLDRFKSVPHDWYGNKGFICRMMGNGFQLDEKSLKSLEKAFMTNLEMLPKEAPQEENTPPIVKYTGPKLKEDPFWSALVDFEDLTIRTKGKPTANSEEWIRFHSLVEKLSKPEQKQAKRTLQHHRQQLVDDVNYAGETALNEKLGASKRTIKRLIDHYDWWINRF